MNNCEFDPLDKDVNNRLITRTYVLSSSKVNPKLYSKTVLEYFTF